MKSSKISIFNRCTLSLLFGVFALSSAAFAAPASQKLAVDEALTGDTVRLSGGKILKYIGVQAPPLQSLIPLARHYGEESLDFNRKLVEHKTIRIEWDTQIRDERGNLLGYVYLEDGTFVNLELLKAGHAKAKITPPNTRFAGSFRHAEQDARHEGRGLWKETPKNPYLSTEYIGEKNTKIFYFPNSPELERIPEANLIKFNSRVAAVAAGYKACSTCQEDKRDAF